MLHEETFNGDFTLADRTVSGSSGSWSLSAVRTSDDSLGGDEFSGNYLFQVSC